MQEVNIRMGLVHFRAFLFQVLRHRPRRPAEQGVHPEGVRRLHPQAEERWTEEKTPRGENQNPGGPKQATTTQTTGNICPE